MKKSFQKSLIAASVGAVMMAAVGTASANSLLFPYFTTAGGAVSVLSISSNPNAAAPVENLHYVYNYGANCTHFDGPGKVTANDLLQHSILRPAEGGFGKVVPTDGSTPFYLPLKDTGFLVVSNTTSPQAASPLLNSVSGDVIQGEMAIVDPTSGLIASYPGVSNLLSTNVAGNEGNFAGGGFDLSPLSRAYNLNLYPTSLVTTSWYGVVSGDMNDAIVNNRDWTARADLTNNGVVYDNDEMPFSGTKTKRLQCAGTVVPSDLMNSAQEASVGPKGGLIHASADLTILGANPADVASGVIMTKLQVLNGTKTVFMHRENGVAF